MRAARHADQSYVAGDGAYVTVMRNTIVEVISTSVNIGFSENVFIWVPTLKAYCYSNISNLTIASVL